MVSRKNMSDPIVASEQPAEQSIEQAQGKQRAGKPANPSEGKVKSKSKEYFDRTLLGMTINGISKAGKFVIRQTKPLFKDFSNIIRGHRQKDADRSQPAAGPEVTRKVLVVEGDKQGADLLADMVARHDAAEALPNAAPADLKEGEATLFERGRGIIVAQLGGADGTRLEVVQQQAAVSDASNDFYGKLDNKTGLRDGDALLVGVGSPKKVTYDQGVEVAYHFTISGAMMSMESDAFSNSILTFADGSKMDVRFLKGGIIEDCETAKRTYKNGAVYEGQINQNGQPSGEGTLTKDGVSYKITCEEGKLTHIEDDVSDDIRAFISDTIDVPLAPIPWKPKPINDNLTWFGPTRNKDDVDEGDAIKPENYGRLVEVRGDDTIEIIGNFINGKLDEKNTYIKIVNGEKSIVYPEAVAGAKAVVFTIKQGKKAEEASAPVIPRVPREEAVDDALPLKSALKSEAPLVSSATAPRRAAEELEPYIMPKISNVDLSSIPEEIPFSVVDSKYSTPFISLEGKPGQPIPGGLFEGELLEGKPEGEGVLTRDNGVILRGTFKNGVLEGQASVTRDNGDVYAGEYINGSLTGLGKLTKANGNVFEGEFVEYRPVRGKETIGDIITEGTKDGRGNWYGLITRTYPDGRVVVGVIVQNKFVPSVNEDDMSERNTKVRFGEEVQVREFNVGRSQTIEQLAETNTTVGIAQIQDAIKKRFNIQESAIYGGISPGFNMISLLSVILNNPDIKNADQAAADLKNKILNPSSVTVTKEEYKEHYVKELNDQITNGEWKDGETRTFPDDLFPKFSVDYLIRTVDEIFNDADVRKVINNYLQNRE